MHTRDERINGTRQQRTDSARRWKTDSKPHMRHAIGPSFFFSGGSKLMDVRQRPPAGRAVEVPDKVMWRGGSEMPVTDVSFMPPTPPRTHTRGRDDDPFTHGSELGGSASPQYNPMFSSSLRNQVRSPQLPPTKHQGHAAPVPMPRPRSVRLSMQCPLLCENWKPGGMLCPLLQVTSRKCNNK